MLCVYVSYYYQAQKKGCSVLVVGLVISASPFCVFITSPLFGYLVSSSSFSTLIVVAVTDPGMFFFL